MKNSESLSGAMTLLCDKEENDQAKTSSAITAPALLPPPASRTNTTTTDTIGQARSMLDHTGATAAGAANPTTITSTNNTKSRVAQKGLSTNTPSKNRARATRAGAIPMSTGADELGDEEQESPSSPPSTTIPHITLPSYRGLRQRTAKLQSHNGPTDTSGRTRAGLQRPQKERKVKVANLAGISRDVVIEIGPESRLASDNTIVEETTSQEINTLDGYIEDIEADPEDSSFVPLPTVSDNNPSNFRRTPTLTSTSGQSHPATQGVTSMVSTSALVVAREVHDDVDDASLMQAEEVNPEQLERKATERRKNKECIVFGIVLMVISLAVLFGVTFGLSAKPNVDLVTSAVPSTAPPIIAQTDLSSSAPSGALDLLRDSLPEYTLTSLETFGTPQWKAMDWLQNHPRLSYMEENNKTQLFALATFYYSMVGDNWRKIIRDKWLLYDKSECFWFETSFGEFSDKTGKWETTNNYGNTTVCNEQGEFQLLDLVGLELTSNSPFIPPEISLLTSLSVLSLPGNDINASLADFLPSQLNQMPHLTVLGLHENSLGGPLPSELGLMTSMTGLYLYSNSLSGTIPSEVGRMTSTTKLYLFSNILSGTIPTEVGRMSAMEDLALYENELIGPLPSELGLMTSTTQLYLDSNSLNGTIPSEVGGIIAMVDLALHKNTLNGPLPSDLGLMTSMNYLWLFSNSLTGSIPSEVGRITSMVELALHENALTGPLPSEFGLMTSTTKLYLYSNSLTGPIPSEVGRMTAMEYLRLRDNGLTGLLPSELGFMTSATKLDLHSNSLMGSVPSQLSQITSLEQLRLENNILTGTVPPELESLVVNGTLTSLTLANNSLSGSIPETLCSLGLFDADVGAGLSFDCSDVLCGCCWCPCPGLTYSTECLTHPFIPSRDDEKWPGSFPFPANRSNAIKINIRTDQYPEEISFEWSVQDESGLWAVLESGSPANANSLHSYTIQVGSDSIYRLQIFDSYGDGACCAHGFGWFTVTNSTPSVGGHVNGTVLWEAAGYDLKDELAVFLSVDATGHVQLADHATEVVSEEANHTAEIMDELPKPVHDAHEWPGQFPTPVNTSNTITINARTDSHPEETSFDWSKRNESGAWKILDLESPQEAESLHSYTKVVQSNAVYKLQLFDTKGDGMCCSKGVGWFTITNSTPSQQNPGGTVIWEAFGSFFNFSFTVFIWINHEGHAKILEELTGPRR